MTKLELLAVRQEDKYSAHKFEVFYMRYTDRHVTLSHYIHEDGLSFYELEILDRDKKTTLLNECYPAMESVGEIDTREAWYAVSERAMRFIDEGNY